MSKALKYLLEPTYMIVIAAAAVLFLIMGMARVRKETGIIVCSLHVNTGLGQLRIGDEASDWDQNVTSPSKIFQRFVMPHGGLAEK
jgi:hypothetical protein